MLVKGAPGVIVYDDKYSNFPNLKNKIRDKTQRMGHDPLARADPP